VKSAWCAMVVTVALVAAQGVAWGETITYEFTGTITDNGGITVFSEGGSATGRFTYDLDATDDATANSNYGRYPSTLNALEYNIAGYTFTATETIYAFVSTPGPWAETIGIAATDLNVPDGWAIDNTSTGDGYNLFLQNAPSAGVLEDESLVDSFVFSDFTSYREFRLYFKEGVSYPGGSVAGTAYVLGEVTSLTLVTPIPEPMTLALLGLGLVGFALHRRRRR